MAWIEVHQSLFTHRKTLELADVLELPEVYVAGHLVALWSWSLDNAPDGILPTSPRIVARAAQWSGDPGQLVDALLEVGYLDMEGANLCIHDWAMYAGRLVEKRKANAERMRQAREANKALTDKERATHVQRTSSARAGATVPNPTQPNSTNPPPTPQGEAVSAAEANFLDFFDEFWQLYPKKVQKPAAMRAARRIAARDRDNVVEACRHYAVSSRVVRGYAKDPPGFLKDEFWKDYISGPILEEQTNGSPKQEPVGSRPPQAGEANAADRKRAEGLRSLLAGNASGPRKT
jgi:hypothetical protein